MVACQVMTMICCLQIFWLVFNNNPTFPADTKGGKGGRAAYDRFLAEAHKGISNKQLLVKPKKAPAEGKAKKKRES